MLLDSVYTIASPMWLSKACIMSAEDEPLDDIFLLDYECNV